MALTSPVRMRVQKLNPVVFPSSLRLTEIVTPVGPELTATVVDGAISQLLPFQRPKP